MGGKQTKTILAFVVTSLGILGVFYLSVLSGGIRVTPGELFRGLFIAYDRNVAIIYDLRFPRILVALLGGAMMAVSGVLMQAVMRNPLAEPGIIGVSSGATLVSALTLTFFPRLSVLTPAFSFLGGMLAFGLVYSLAWGEGMSPLRLILIGIAMNTLFTGLSDVFSAASGSSYTGAASILQANISLKSWADVKLLAAYGGVGLLLSLLTGKCCNLLALSDQNLAALGIHPNGIRLAVSVVSVLLASICAAVIGTVSFLGLIVPHIARLLVGSDHKKLIPYSALLGGLVFLGADTLGRVIAYPYEISASVLMSVIGGITFVILLKGNKKAYSI